MVDAVSERKRQNLYFCVYTVLLNLLTSITLKTLIGTFGRPYTCTWHVYQDHRDYTSLNILSESKSIKVENSITSTQLPMPADFLEIGLQHNNNDQILWFLLLYFFYDNMLAHFVWHNTTINETLMRPDWSGEVPGSINDLFFLRYLLGPSFGITIMVGIWTPIFDKFAIGL